jgi:hypothetical protein
MDETSAPKYLTLPYLLLSALFLLSFGISKITSELDTAAWIRQVFALVTLVLVGLSVWNVARQRGFRFNLWTFGCCLYGLLIVLEALVHFSALVRLPTSFILNVDGLIVQQWLRRNWQFAILYLYFPILCLLQYWFFKQLMLSSVVRILIAIMLLSFLCVIFSRVAPSVLEPRSFMGGRRFQGLSTSPNAYALAVFLLLPWIASSLLGKAGKAEKSTCAFCLLLALWGVVESGSRTASMMILAFLVIAPVVVARAPPPKTRRTHMLPLIVALLLVVALVLGAFVVFEPDDHQSSGKLGARLSEIGTRIKDRGIAGILFRREARGFHSMVAGAMFLRAPLAGWGPGGFYREFPNATFLATGRIRPTKDSALNHYLMIGGDLGVLILALNLFLVLAPLWAGFRALRTHTDRRKQVVIRLLILGNILFLLGITFMPPSYFQEVLWLWTGQLAYLIVLGEKSGLSLTSRSRRFDKKFMLAVGGITALVLVGTVSVSHGSLGYPGRHQKDWWPWRYLKNCYNIERWAEGEGCWCKSDAILQFPYFVAPPETLKIRIAAYHPDIRHNPVTVHYGGITGSQETVTFKTPSWKTISIPITDAYLFSPTASRECRHWKLPWLPPSAKSIAPTELWYVVLRLQTSRTWKPSEWGEHPDARELALKVLLPETKLGRGCYRSEQWQEGNVTWCRENAVLEVPLTGIPPSSAEVSLRATHPDIHKNPVVVRFGAIGGPTDSITITDHAWRDLSIPVTGNHMWSTAKIRSPMWWYFLGIPRPRESWLTRQRREQRYFVLSVHTSRHWIPVLWGVSDDTRELGVAVLVRGFRFAPRTVNPNIEQSGTLLSALHRRSQYQDALKHQSD